VKIEDSEVRDEYVAWGESVGLDAETLRREKLPEELARTVRERVIRRKAVDLIVDAAAPKYLPWSEFLTRHEEEDESPAESAEGEGQTVPMEEPAHEE
jgi:hypothetical protein